MTSLRQIFKTVSGRIAARWNDVALKRRFLLINLGVNVIGISLLAGFIVLAESASFRQAALQETRAQAAMIASNINAVLVFQDERSAHDILAALGSQQDVAAAQLRDKLGQPFARYTRGGNNAALPAPPVLPNNADYAFTDCCIFIRREVTFSGNKVGTLEMWVEQSRLYSRRWELITFTLLIAALATLVTGIILAFFQRLLARPLVALMNAMQIVKKTRDYSLRVPVSSKDEVGQFTTGFNDMLAQIETQQRDLRTELAERTEAEHRLVHIAHHDSVTSLPNRHYFSRTLAQRLKNSLAAGQPLTVIFLDLDNFKYVNDTLGHHAGDVLLREVADRLLLNLRSGDVLCRIGGDEFAIIAEGVLDRPQTEHLAKKLIAKLNEVFHLFNEKIFIGTSIGIAIAPRDGDEPQVLLRNADAAMYHAKSQGKNNFQFYAEDMNQRFAERFKIESALRNALDSNEFFLQYQPQFDILSGRIIGIEALIRWRDRSGLLHTPDQFIPIAEEMGLDTSIGEWVIERACAQLRTWLDAGMPALPVAINVSGQQFSRRDMPALVANVLEKHAIPPALLGLEITESTLIQNPENCVRMLNELKKMGISIAIDDFGVGYSSLGYLRRFPLDKIKIDKSFIRDIPNNPDSVSICDAIIALASALKLEVLAEGVEHADQLHFLKARGCKQAQGFLWSAAVDPEVIFSRLMENKSVRPDSTVIPFPLAHQRHPD